MQDLLMFINLFRIKTLIKFILF